MPGFDNNVVYAGNLDFSGGAVPAGQLVADGQLIIGATGLNPAVAVLTSGDGSTTIASGAGTIGLTVTQATEGQLGGAEVATAAETIAYASDALIITPTKLTSAFSSPQPIGDTTPSTGDFTVMSGVGNGAGAQEVISIIPTVAIGAVEWDGIHIDGTALDPTAANSDVHGIHIDFSATSIVNDPELIGLDVEMPAVFAGDIEKAAGYFRGFGLEVELCSGDHEASIMLRGRGRMDFDATGLVAGDSLTSFQFNIDEVGSTGGELHVLNVSSTGTGTAGIHAVGTNPEVGVIHQHTGVFAAVAQGWKENGGFTDTTAAFDNPAVNVTVFDGDNDYIYIGSNAVFSQVRALLNTAATRSIFPVFEYSSIGPVWNVFNPTDGTDGFTQSGLIEFDSADLAGWAAVNVNGGNFFYIRIQRTRNNIGTIPIEEIIRVLEPQEYYWNEDGEILISAITGVGANFTTVDAGTFDTNVAAAGLEMSATTLSADGTDANIDISITPKGTGVLLTPAIGNAADTTAIAITAAGEVTMPLQPAFLAYLGAGNSDLNVTGAAAVYTLGSGNALTEVFDQNADFNTNGTFTSPVTGRYSLIVTITYVEAGGATTGTLFMATSNRDYRFENSGDPSAANTGSLTLSTLADMDAGDTVTTELSLNGVGANTADVFGAANLYTYFAGNLVV